MGNASKPKEKKYLCRYCGLQFSSREQSLFHQENECDFNPNLLKDKNPLSFIIFLTTSTLKVAGLALLVISPALLYLYLLTISPQYGYLSLALFWIVLFGVTTVLASIVDYLRKTKSETN